MSKVTIFSVCGGGEDYDFLLGSIEHHAKLGNHLVFDVCPSPRRFQNLPPSVKWVSAPLYDSGSWTRFRTATALNRAIQMALDAFPDTEFLVYLDCDEYFDVDKLRPLLHRYERPPIEVPRAFVFPTIHWKGGKALEFGASEFHLRAWDVRAKVALEKNPGWKAAPHYDGNPENHCLVVAQAKPAEMNIIRQPMHYHLHFNVGKKRLDTKTAELTISGWPNGKEIADPCPWPEPIRSWAAGKELPSTRFS